MGGLGGQRWQVVDVSFGVLGEQWGGGGSWGSMEAEWGHLTHTSVWSSREVNIWKDGNRLFKNCVRCYFSDPGNLVNHKQGSERNPHLGTSSENQRKNIRNKPTGTKEGQSDWQLTSQQRWQMPYKGRMKSSVRWKENTANGAVSLAKSSFFPEWWWNKDILSFKTTKKLSSSRILDSAVKVFFSNEGEIITLSGHRKLRESVASTPAPQETLRKVLHADRKNSQVEIQIFRKAWRTSEVGNDVGE